MQQPCMHRPIMADRRVGQNVLLALLVSFFIVYAVPVSAQSKPNKIQQSIDSIKETYTDENRDYITDGQRIVWVKSYKKWLPSDFPTIKKEAPHVLKFFYQAIEHQRLDVLEQLLPNYYRFHGGVQAFVEDIKKTR
jgi:hypothetical protein